MITVYGKSDDLIYVESDNGGIREEFNVYPAVHTFLLAFSDGTVLTVEDKGIWRIKRVLKGTAMYLIKEGTGEAGDGSDVVTLDGEISWAVCARDLFELVRDCNTCLDDEPFQEPLGGQPGKGMGTQLWDMRREV